jgi:hypothetical protein
MRQCDNCKKPDHPTIDPSARCRMNRTTGNPECDPRQDQWDIATHVDDCPRIRHEVVEYRRVVQTLSWMRPVADPLPLRLQAEGWRIKVEGTFVYRVKMLCNACIVNEVQRETRQRNHLKAKRAAAGKDTTTYNQILLHSGF